MLTLFLPWQPAHGAGGGEKSTQADLSWRHPVERGGRKGKFAQSICYESCVISAPTPHSKTFGKPHILKWELQDSASSFGSALISITQQWALHLQLCQEVGPISWALYGSTVWWQEAWCVLHFWVTHTEHTYRLYSLINSSFVYAAYNSQIS